MNSTPDTPRFCASRLVRAGDRIEDSTRRDYTDTLVHLFYTNVSQVPYAIGQFYTNETMHELVGKVPSLDKLGKSGKAGEVTIQLGCGLTAGVAAAILSHPADTLLSKINKGGGGSGSAMSKLVTLAKETGPVGIWAGLGTRIAMTAFLVGGQFLIYGQIKQALGAPAGVSITKAEVEKSS